MAELIIDATTGTITGTVGLTLDPGVSQSVTIGGNPILGGNHYPTTTGGSTEFLKSNGDGTISWTEVTHPAMTGATSGTNGIAGIVPAPAAGDQAKFLRGDATWAVFDTSSFLVKTNNLSDVSSASTSRDNLGTGPITGFPVDSSNNYYVDLTYNESTRTITITPTGSTFDVFCYGNKVTKTGAQSIQHGTQYGGHFIYYDTNGTLVTGQTPWDLIHHAPVAYVFWDSTNSRGLPFFELHHSGRDTFAHKRLHSVDGTQIESGFSVAGYTLATDSDAGVTFSVSSGVIADEDIQFTTEALTDGTAYVIFRRIGASGNWQFSKTSTLPFLNGSTNIAYNQNTGATWQMTDVTANYFVNYYAFATTALNTTKITPTPSNSQQIILIPGQAIYTTLTAAQAETVGNLSYGSLPFQEIAPLYQITFEYKSAFGGTGKCKIQSFNRIIGNRATITSTATSGVLYATNNLSDLTNVTTARANLGLTIGTSAGNVIVLDGSAKLPAVDGSQLTNVSGGGAVDANTLALYSMIFGG